MKNKTLSLSRLKIDEKWPLQYSWCEFVAKTTYFSSIHWKTASSKKAAFSLNFAEAGTSKYYCATNKLRFTLRLS
jgi:hypothetical protein